jgi:RNA polymerase sigma-70 factor (sigma-E family)
MTDSVDTQGLDDFTDLFVGHYQQLLRLAALLLGDLPAAEDVVQEAFIRVHRVLGRGRVTDPLAYLRQTVVNLSRSDLRRRMVARRHAPKPMPDVASAEEGAYAALARREVVVALRALPARQREAVVLRYWADLTEAQTGRLMGISTGAVKAYTSRGLARLGQLLEESR